MKNKYEAGIEKIKSNLTENLMSVFESVIISRKNHYENKPTLRPQKNWR